MNKWKSIGLSVLAISCAANSAFAQGDSGTNGGGTVYSKKTIIESTSKPGFSSSSEVVEQKGVMGIKQANTFAPKYKERLNTYNEQIQMGLTKGWLKQEDADRFRPELERLRKLEADAASQNYPKNLVDDLDKQLTQFNIDFTKAATPAPPKPAATTAAPAAPATPVKAAAPVAKAKAAPAKKPVAVKKATSTKKK